MEAPDKKAKLTGKQEKFCREFIKDFNATKSAERSGYSKATAYSIGSENLKKPDIKARIAELLEIEEMQEGEIKKRLSSIAKTDMANYMVKKTVPYTPQIKVGLEVIISRLRSAIDFEDDYALQVNLKDKELKAHMAGQEYRRREIIRCKLELDRNPGASRIIDGETILVETAELNLVKLLDDKERGVIKSIKHTKDGVQAEAYAADNALTTLAKFKGMQIDKVEHSGEIDTPAPKQVMIFNGKEIEF